MLISSVIYFFISSNFMFIYGDIFEWLKTSKHCIIDFLFFVFTKPCQFKHFSMSEQVKNHPKVVLVLLDVRG